MLNLSDKLQAILQGLDFLMSEVWIAVLLLGIIILDLIIGKQKGKLLSIVVLLGVLVNVFAIHWHTLQLDTVHFFGALYGWKDAAFFKYLFNSAIVLTVLMGLMKSGNTESHRVLSGEYLAILLSILLGLQVMVSASNWLMLYLGIELVSIGSYVLTFFRYNKQSAEASLKYLIFGAVSSAIMLYGISLVYGLTGNMQFPSVLSTLESPLQAPPFLHLLGYGLLFGGLFFKISAIPFHNWVPDVYESAPTPFVAFLSVAPKAAGLAAMMHIAHGWHQLAIPIQEGLVGLIVIVSALSMAVGNFSALWQQDAKRLLGYSSIAHAGFLLIGILTLKTSGEASFYFYLAVYFLLSYAAFMLVSLLEKEQKASLSQTKGLGLQKPWLGISMLLVMIGLTGLPFTAGFNAKLFLFSALWETYQQAGNTMYMWLFFFGLLNTIVALYYYLKIPFFMFFRQGSTLNTAWEVDAWQKSFAILLVVPTVLFFFKPDWLQYCIEVLMH